MKLNGNQQLLISSLVILLSGLRLSAQENSPQGLERRFRGVVSDPAMHFNGTVVVAENGKIIYRNAVGYADIDKKIMNGGATRFSLASLSKVFTAVAVMQLKENGKLKLDDPLGKFLPDFPYPAITIPQFLSTPPASPDFLT